MKSFMSNKKKRKQQKLDFLYNIFIIPLTNNEKIKEEMWPTRETPEGTSVTQNHIPWNIKYEPNQVNYSPKPECIKIYFSRTL